MIDDSPSPPRTARRRFIPGIYNFCDAWCDRCRGQTRCRLLQQRLIDLAVERGEAAPRDLFDEEDDPDAPPMTPEARAEMEALIARACEEPTAEEKAAIEEEYERVERLARKDDLVLRARDYGEIAYGIVLGLDPQVKVATGDEVVGAALDIIGRFSLTISVKVYRAVRHLYDRRDGDDEFLMDDANGTARLVRLLIDESRDAWAVLMQPGTATADGVPARMIARLDAIDAALAARFPGAMAFVRPGLDEEDQESDSI